MLVASLCCCLAHIAEVWRVQLLVCAACWVLMSPLTRARLVHSPPANLGCAFTVPAARPVPSTASLARLQASGA